MDNKRKVLYFIPRFSVLSETFITREVEKLYERDNVDVKVLSLVIGDAEISSDLKNKVFFRRVGIKHILFGIIFSLLHPIRSVTALKVVLGCSQRSAISCLYLFLKSLGYAVIIREFKPDIIHCHFLSEPSTIILLVSVISGIPFSVSAHARDVFGKSKDVRLNSELIAEKVKYAKFVTLCNKKAYNHVIQVAGNEYFAKVILQYHGVDKTKISPRLDIKRNPPYALILAVGRLELKKGFRYLIESAELLKNKKIDFKIRIIGPGPLFKELNDLIYESNLLDFVEIVGSGKGLPNHEVIEQMRKSDIFVLPSIETEDKDTEGIPNTLVEAAFVGLPIVTTNTGSIGEIFKDGESALFSKQKDSKHLSRNIEKIIKDEDLKQNLVKNAYKIVTSKFDLNKNIVNLENRLMDVV